MNNRKPLLSLKWFLYIPAGIYFLSYLYLAVYHDELNILTTVIHEGGTFTFLETLLYASHFLGHIPVHTVLAFYFVGIFLCLDRGIPPETGKQKGFVLLFIWIAFIAASLALSFKWFGGEDTLSFIYQQKQSVVRYEQGGSWNLHLPSTIMQFLLIPPYIFVSKIIFRSRLKPNRKGIWFIGTSVGLFVLITWLVNENMFAALLNIWKDPRYLAHSVRELLTFPVTYYPVPLYFFLRDEQVGRPMNLTEHTRVTKWMVGLSAVSLILFAYQAILPLMVGIGELAQKPSFAANGDLSIVYLLSSHYFEHFLDTVYFILLCLILYNFTARRSQIP